MGRGCNHRKKNTDPPGKNGEKCLGWGLYVYASAREREENAKF